MIYSKKSLGQNFLRDKNVIIKIVNTVNIRNKNVIEIGPGYGALTNEIVNQNPKNLFLIEKDTNLFKNLKLRFQSKKNIKILNKDFLKFDLETINKKDLIIFGNLPYNVSSQILVKLIKFKNLSSNCTDLILMFQKELGEKIIAKFPSKNYGRLTILSNFKLNLKKKFLVSPDCFKPKPKVTSIVLHLKPKNKEISKIKNIQNLEKITNILFSNKRKMINKNIFKILNEDKIKKIDGLKMNMRPSEIKPNLYFKITEIFENN